MIGRCRDQSQPSRPKKCIILGSGTEKSRLWTRPIGPAVRADFPRLSCQRQDAHVLPKRRQSHQGDKLCDVSTVPLVARWPVFLARGSDADGEPHSQSRDCMRKLQVQVLASPITLPPSSSEPLTLPLFALTCHSALLVYLFIHPYSAVHHDHRRMRFYWPLVDLLHNGNIHCVPSITCPVPNTTMQGGRGGQLLRHAVHGYVKEI